MTHSEMTHMLPAPQTVPFSACPGEMVETQLSKALASYVGDGHGRVARRTELWHCELCEFTIVTEVDARNVRRIRNGYPAPSLPPLKIAQLN
jgi:hypothetical protein